MSYQSIWTQRRNEILTIAERVKLANPAAWEEIKMPGQPSRVYINMVSLALLEAGIPGGVNLKRGGPQQSIDVLAFPNASGARDSTGTYPGLELIDIGNAAEGPNASLGWGDVTQVTIDSGNPGGWKAGSLSAVPAPASPAQPYPSEPGYWNNFTAEVKKRYPGGQLNDEAFRWFTRTAYDIGAGMDRDLAAQKHIKELDEQIGR